MAVAALASFLFAASTVRYLHHWSVAYDGGLFDQGVWLLSRFRAPELTIMPDNLFGDHLSPVLLLYVPLYWIRATPVWMLASQAAALGFTILPMRTLARDLGVRPGWATALLVGSAPLQMASLYDFHPVMLTLPVVTWALGAARRGDARACTVAVVLVALIRADAAVLMLGVAVLGTRPVRRRVVPLALASMAAGALVPALLHSDQTFDFYYGSLGTGPGDALVHPWRIVTTLLGAQSFRSLVVWLLPVAFLPVLRPRWFLALAVAGLPLLLSTFANTANPLFHHAGTLVPFTVGGALAALAHFGDNDRIRLLLGGGLLGALLVFGPLAPGNPPAQRFTGIVRDGDPGGLDGVLAQIRPDDRVAAVNVVATALAQRREVYVLDCGSSGGGCDPNGRPGQLVDVVVTTTAHRGTLVQRGWQVTDVAGGPFVIGRPPTS